MAHVDSSEVRKLSVDLSRASGTVGAKGAAVIRKTAFAIEGTSKVLAPVDFGTLEGSISTDITNDGRFSVMEAEIGPTVDYGDDVEYGTGPHIIRPKTPGGMLAFQVGGQTVFARQVNHPGTAPQPYMGPAFDRHAPGFADAMGDIGEDIL